MSERLEANAEEIAKVHEVLKKGPSRGFMIEGIEQETGYPNYIILSAIRTLKAQGVNVQNVDPFAYEPTADDTDPENPEQ